jgi:hypothetical protein
MRLAHYLRLLRRSFSSGRSSPCKRQSRLELEWLEDRVVPTILFGKPKAQTVDPHSGSQVFQKVDVQLIFWGAKTDYKDADNIYAAVLDIVGDTYTSKLHQYGITGVGSVLTPVYVTDSSPAETFSDESVKAMLQKNMKNGNLPEPASDVDSSGFSQLLYFVVPQSGSSASTSDYLGLHSHGTWVDGEDESSSIENTDADTDDCTNTYHYGWTINDGTLDQVTSTFSHELVEAMTDPEGTGIQIKPARAGNWNEIADNAAEGYTYRLDTYLVQAYWSQSDHRFVGPDGNTQTLDVNAAGKLTIAGDQIAGSLDDKIIVSVGSNTDPVTYKSVNAVQVHLNDELTTFGPGVIKSIEVDPGKGSNTVAVDTTLAKIPVTIQSAGSDAVVLGNPGEGLQGILSDVTVKNSAGHLTDLVVNDAFDAKPRKVTISDKAIKGMTPAPKGLSPASIFYDAAGLKSLIIHAGALPNFFTITDTPGDKAVSIPTTLSLFGFADTVNVQGTTGPLTITESTGHAIINVSNEAKVKGIKGDLSVVTLPVFGQGVDLIVDDTLDRDSHKVTISDKSITGLAPASISYSGPNLKSLIIRGGFGDNTYDVTETPTSGIPGFAVLLKGNHGKDHFTVTATTSPLTLDGNGGTDVVKLGDPSTGLTALQGAVKVLNTGETKLTVDDRGDTAAQSVGISDKGITGMSSASITYKLAAGSSVTLDGGSGSDTITVAPSKHLSFVIDGDGSDTLGLTDDAGAEVHHTGKHSGKITFAKTKAKDILFAGIAEVNVSKERAK